VGYYVDYEGTISYPRADEQRLAEALWNLNHQHDLKNGGRHPKSGDPYEDNWFSWMPTRWHEDEPSVAKVLEMLGFTVDETNPFDIIDGENIYYTVAYNNKIGDEDKFIATLAEHGADVTIYCRGEDGEGWRWRSDHSFGHSGELLISEEYRTYSEEEHPFRWTPSYRVAIS